MKFEKNDLIEQLVLRFPALSRYLGKHSSLRNKVLGGYAWEFAGQALISVLGVILNVLLARLLPPDQVGAFFLASSVLAILSTAILLGFKQAIVKLVSESLGEARPGRARQAIRWVIQVGSVSAMAGGAFLILGGGSSIGTSLFKAPVISEVSTLLGIWLVVSSLQILAGEIFRGLQDLRVASMFGGQGAITRVLTVLLLMVVWLFNAEVTFRLVILLAALSNVITFLPLVVLLRGKVRSIGSEPGDPLPIRDLFDLAWPLWINSLALIFITQADIVLLGILQPEQDVALYGMAVRLSLIISMPLMILNRVLSPIVAELYAARAISRLEKLLRSTVTVLFFPALMVFLLFVGVGSRLLSMLFGEFFEQAHLLLVLLSLGQLVNVTSGSCGILLKMTGHHSQFMGITIATGLLTLPLYFFLISLYGTLGAALAATLNLVSSLLLAMFYSYKKLGIRTWPILRISKLPL